MLRHNKEIIIWGSIMAVVASVVTFFGAHTLISKLNPKLPNITGMHQNLYFSCTFAIDGKVIIYNKTHHLSGQ